MTDEIGILGLESSLPLTERRNDDPIFGYLHKHPDSHQTSFPGFEVRRVLGPGDKLVDLLVQAARKALIDAGVEADAIDHVLGAVSPSQFAIPDSLYQFSQKMNLPRSTLTIPVNNDFCNFNVAVRLADALVRAGQARYVLVAIAGGWSQAVSYTTAQGFTAGDGAASCVVGRGKPLWTVVDAAVLTEEMNFGDMFLAGEERETEHQPPVPDLLPGDPTLRRFTGQYFVIKDKGFTEFRTFGQEQAWKAAEQVIRRQGLAPGDVTLIGHQASTAFFDTWRKELKVEVLDTLAGFGNMTVANVPVTFHHKQDEIKTPYVVTLSLAPDMHAHALLLRRGNA